MTDVSSPNVRLPKAALTHMDLLRGLSAVAVLVGHVRGPFFTDMRDVLHPSMPMRALYLVTGLGHQAVVVFFVLSGFFIGTSVLGSTSKQQWSWRHFLLRRFARLYVVLVPALLLTLVLDLVGMRLFGTDNIYSGKLNAPFLHLFDARETLTFPSFVANLFFLQSTAIKPYGTNSALWSLGYEFWSYVLFPLLLIGAGPRATLRSRAFHLVPALLIAILGGVELVFYFGIWLLGALVAWLWRSIATRYEISRWLVTASFLAFICVLVAVRALQSPKAGDFALGLATASFLACLLARAARQPAMPNAKPEQSRYATFAVRLAGFSYTLYLVHFPMMALFHAALIDGERWQPTPSHLGVAAALCLTILAFAFAMAQLTERNTDTVRAWAEQHFAKLMGSRPSTRD